MKYPVLLPEKENQKPVAAKKSLPSHRHENVVSRPQKKAEHNIENEPQQNGVSSKIFDVLSTGVAGISLILIVVFFVMNPSFIYGFLLLIAFVAGQYSLYAHYYHKKKKFHWYGTNALIACAFWILVFVTNDKLSRVLPFWLDVPVSIAVYATSAITVYAPVICASTKLSEWRDKKRRSRRKLSTKKPCKSAPNKHRLGKSSNKVSRERWLP